MNDDTDELFDLELAAVRAGVPGAIPLPSKITTAQERAYLEGLAGAGQRDPGDLERLASGCTIDETTGRVELPDTPDDIRAAEREPLSLASRATLLALLEPRS